MLPTKERKKEKKKRLGVWRRCVSRRTVCLRVRSGNRIASACDVTKETRPERKKKRKKKKRKKRNVVDKERATFWFLLLN